MNHKKLYRLYTEDKLGVPVTSARFMGGREHEVIPQWHVT